VALSGQLSVRDLLHAQPPRVQCPRHGVRQKRLPWAEPRSRFTTLYERFAIDVLTETGIRGAAQILRRRYREVCQGPVSRPHLIGEQVRDEGTPMRGDAVDSVQQSTPQKRRGQPWTMLASTCTRWQVSSA
jgi:hypothetical protein